MFYGVFSRVPVMGYAQYCFRIVSTRAILVFAAEKFDMVGEPLLVFSRCSFRKVFLETFLLRLLRCSCYCVLAVLFAHFNLS